MHFEKHLETVLAVVKMRGSEHAKDFWRYTLTGEGAVIAESLVGYHGITTGVPDFVGKAPADNLEV